MPYYLCNTLSIQNESIYLYGGFVALKPITLRLDEEEYEKLRQHLNEFGDPDINVAYVLRAYIRDLNRTMPILLKSGWDLKNYFGMLGSWLKQFSSLNDVEMLAELSVKTDDEKFMLTLVKAAFD